MKNLKIAVIGAGSPYTPELVGGLASRGAEINADEISLFDIDAKRLETIAAFCARYAARLKFTAKINAAKNLEEALHGADYVVTQIRVGGNRQRVFDEKIPGSFGLIGQETTGAGGAMKALRTIPVMLGIAKKMENYCPGAFIVNYANPTGMVTEAVTRFGRTRIAGLCSGGLFPEMWAQKALGISPGRLGFDYFGLNHMNFTFNIKIDGKNITDEQFESMAKQNPAVDAGLAKILGAIPSPYLQYFFHRQRCIAQQKEAAQTRGEQVVELEKEIFDAFAERNREEIPEALSRRGGGGYSEVAAKFICASEDRAGAEMVLNAPNNGAVSFLPHNAVVETVCNVNERECAPLKNIKVPPPCVGLIAAVKNYEQLAVEAAVEGCEKKLTQAFAAHPLIADYGIIKKMIPELLEANKEYLPQFYK